MRIEKRKIYLVDKTGKKKLIIPDLGKGPVRYLGTHAFGRIPVKWLNNEEFVYVKYKYNNDKGTVWRSTEKDKEDSSEITFSRLVADTLPCCTGEFRIYNLKSKVDSLFYKMDSIYAPSVDDKFLDYDGDLVFRNSGFSYHNYWKLDLKRFTVSPYTFSSGFKTKADTSYHPKGFEHRKNIVLWKGEEIGAFYGQDYEDIDGVYVACGQLQPGEKKYIMFWSDQTKKWAKAELNGFLGLMTLFKPSW